MFHDYFYLNPNRVIKEVKLPEKIGSIYIIEDLYLEPDRVVWLANQLNYSGFSNNAQFKRYIGERATVSVLHEDLKKIVHSLTNTSLPLTAFRPVETLFTKFNTSDIKDMDVRQFVPHVDNDSITSSLIYLFDDRNLEFGGTAFYKHKPSGLSVLPHFPNEEVSSLMKKESLNPSLKADFVKYIKNIMYSELDVMERHPGFTGLPQSSKCWELLYMAKPKYNSQIVFPAQIFHSPVIQSTEHRKNERLTQNIFLRAK
ncbi:DUF6445 family protein [Aeromonas caviae]